MQVAEEKVGIDDYRGKRQRNGHADRPPRRPPCPFQDEEAEEHCREELDRNGQAQESAGPSRPPGPVASPGEDRQDGEHERPVPEPELHGHRWPRQERNGYERLPETARWQGHERAEREKQEGFESQPEGACRPVGEQGEGDGEKTHYRCVGHGVGCFHDAVLGGWEMGDDQHRGRCRVGGLAAENRLGAGVVVGEVVRVDARGAEPPRQVNAGQQATDEHQPPEGASERWRRHDARPRPIGPQLGHMSSRWVASRLGQRVAHASGSLRSRSTRP